MEAEGVLVVVCDAIGCENELVLGPAVYKPIPSTTCTTSPSAQGVGCGDYKAIPSTTTTVTIP